MEIIKRTTENKNRIDRLRQTGALVRVLPAVYAPPGIAHTWEARVAALGVHDPAAVITREAAAAVQWWPELSVTTVSALRGRGSRKSMPGFTWEQRRVDDIRVIDGIQFASPAITVLDLLDTLGDAALYEALRRRVVTISQLKAALPAHVRGAPQKRRLLGAASDEPWSCLELKAHRLLRDAGIGGWVANHRVRFGRLVSYVFDVAFPELRLALEFDGWEFHGTRSAFAQDRARDLYVAQRGWATYRFDETSLSNPGHFVTSVRRIITLRSKSAS